MDEDHGELGFWLVIVTVLLIFSLAFAFVYNVSNEHKERCQRICGEAEAHLDHHTHSCDKCYCSTEDGSLVLKEIY